MSRLVRIPTSRPSASVIGTPENLNRFISSSASNSRAVLGSVTGSEIMPLWLRLTFCTSAAWSAIDMLRWITPIPPLRAMAIAMRPSVTLSIAAETSGTESTISAANTGRGVDCVGQRLGVAGDDDHVVEGERVVAVEEGVVVFVHVDVAFVSSAVVVRRWRSRQSGVGPAIASVS